MLYFCPALPYYRDEERASSDEYLCITKCPKWGIATIEGGVEEGFEQPICETTRVLKAAAISDILRFLEEYACFLKEKSSYFEEAAKLAEKIQKACECKNDFKKDSTLEDQPNPPCYSCIQYAVDENGNFTSATNAFEWRHEKHCPSVPS